MVLRAPYGALSYWSLIECRQQGIKKGFENWLKKKPMTMKIRKPSRL
jgi:hypothetical protein